MSHDPQQCTVFKKGINPQGIFHLAFAVLKDDSLTRLSLMSYRAVDVLKSRRLIMTTLKENGFDVSAATEQDLQKWPSLLCFMEPDESSQQSLSDKDAEGTIPANQIIINTKIMVLIDEEGHIISDLSRAHIHMLFRCLRNNSTPLPEWTGIRESIESGGR